MIELRDVSKRYGTVEALRDVSFTAPDKHIIGLLGINGAGKSTALNVLTGYFPPTSGQVLVGGVDMLRDPRACKRQIGYLPEKPPLYDEMTVRDYLRFACELKDVKRASVSAHVDEIIGLTGLKEVRGRVIGHLSKGYRQRVGFAQALCGSPETLVLDEPTVGLDPRQVSEIRTLMQQLSLEHTIIFSSHMLSEIQQMCDRVVILHRGRVVREADLADLTDTDGRTHLRVSIAMDESQLLPALKGLPFVRRVRQHTSALPHVTEVTLDCDADGAGRGDPRVQLFRLLAGLDAPILHLAQERDSLEDVFLRVTSGEEAAAV